MPCCANGPPGTHGVPGGRAIKGKNQIIELNKTFPSPVPGVVQSRYFVWGYLCRWRVNNFDGSSWGGPIGPLRGGGHIFFFFFKRDSWLDMKQTWQERSIGVKSWMKCCSNCPRRPHGDPYGSPSSMNWIVHVHFKHCRIQSQIVYHIFIWVSWVSSCSTFPPGTMQGNVRQCEFFE